jgi:hypothetical protein
MPVILATQEAEMKGSRFKASLQSIWLASVRPRFKPQYCPKKIIYIHTYIYTHTYIHTYMHIYIYENSIKKKKVGKGQKVTRRFTVGSVPGRVL